MTQRLVRLRVLHDEIDREANRLSQRHAARLNCTSGCCGCCQDGLTVLAIEAERIRSEFADLLAQEAPAPPGACAFLDGAGRCRIYAARPYVCRTQGLPLYWLEEDEADELVERRAICELNEPGEPLSEVDTLDHWVIGPYEQRLLELNDDASAGDRRVALRELFSTHFVTTPSVAS